VVDLGGFRAWREERKRERRYGRAFAAGAPDLGRRIPPPVNPDVYDMVDQVKACYFDLGRRIVSFQDEIVELTERGELERREREGLLGHYRDLHVALDAATMAALEWRSGAGHRVTRPGRIDLPAVVHRIADYAKYVYAVGTRDIAGLQFRLAELAHTGRLVFKEHERLQWDHCVPTWEALYIGTLSAVADQSTWDGAWAWYDNTYSDGRQVMVQARMKNWMDLDRDWPYNAGMAGDGPIQEHPRGSLCQIFPVIDANKGRFYDYLPMEIDLEELLEQLGPQPAGLVTRPESATGNQ
jgi:hypothetical protein